MVIMVVVYTSRAHKATLAFTFGGPFRKGCEMLSDAEQVAYSSFIGDFLANNS